MLEYGLLPEGIVAAEALFRSENSRAGSAQRHDRTVPPLRIAIVLTSGTPGSGSITPGWRVGRTTRRPGGGSEGSSRLRASGSMVSPHQVIFVALASFVKGMLWNSSRIHGGDQN